MATLLEKASRIRSESRNAISTDVMELAVAWATNKIGLQDAALAMGIGNNSAYIQLARALKHAIELGILVHQTQSNGADKNEP